MKPRKRWLSLAVTPFALAFLAYAQLAHAAPYVGDCASIPNHVTGDATVSDTACVIDTGATLIVDGTLTIDATTVDVKSEIQSVGKVTIRTNGGGELKLRKKASSQNSDILLQSPQNRIETKALETGNSVQVDAGLNGSEGATWDIQIDGPIVASKLQAVPQDPSVHSNVLLRAVGPISTKTIRTDGGLGAASVKMGGIQIEAYRNGGIAADTAEFVIGSAGALNGVNGDLITHTTIGGGTDPVFMQGGVYITMGGRFSTGSIRVVDMAAIKVRATQSRAGMILMNSNLGTIFLPTGTLNVNGDMTNNQGAGMIILLAKTLDVQPGTIISNNQSETAPGMGHQIFICVETIKYRGDGTNGLKILNDGNGYPGYFSLVNISPQGYLVPTGLTSDVNRMPWNFTFSSAELAKDGPLTIDGVEGNAQIVLRSDGNTAAVNVSGYPLAFNGGDVTVRSRGQTLHRINVGFFGTVNGTRPGLTVNNVGNWVLDANGQAPASGGPAAGGIIQVKADQTSLTALDSVTDPSSGNIVIRANGADSAGDGGIISVDTKSFVLGATTHAAIRADGAPNGTGNAVKNPLDSAGPFAVLLKIGSSDLILGGGNRAIRISANGGGVSGNGGTVKVEPSAKIKVRDSLAVDASVSSDDSDGGIIGLLSSEVTFVGANLVDPQTAIRAKAGANGNGGEITVNHTPDQFDRIAILDGTQSDGTPAIAARQNLAPKKGELVDVNGVPCRDYPDPSIVWPSHYRLCTFTRESPNAIDLAPLNLAKSAALDGIRNLFAQKRVSIYVFTDGSYHNTAFNDLADLRHGSYTLNIRGGGRAYVSIWQKGSIGQTTSTPPNYNQFQVTEVAAHEFGHAVGVSRSDDDVSTTDVYKTYIARDGYDLDWLTIPGTQTKVRRDPCAPTSYQLNGQTVVSAAKPPFEGVVDLNRGNQAVCVADENGNPVLAADYASAQDNQTILTVLIENSIWGSFAEVHAQSFGHNLVGNQGARPMTDKVFDNSKGITLDDSYFVCSRAWAEAERLGNPKPNPDTLSPSGSCSVAP